MTGRGGGGGGGGCGALAGLLLTSIWGVGRGSVEEAGRAGHSQVHASVSVAVHTVADGVVARLLGGAAGDVPTRGHTAGVPAVAHWGDGERDRERRRGWLDTEGSSLRFLFGICWKAKLLPRSLMADSNESSHDVKLKCKPRVSSTCFI